MKFNLFLFFNPKTKISIITGNFLIERCYKILLRNWVTILDAQIDGNDDYTQNRAHKTHETQSFS